MYQEQLECAADIVDKTRLFFTETPDIEAEAEAVLSESHVPEVLTAFLHQVEQAESFAPEDVRGMFKAVQKETGHRGKALFMPLRAALTGQTHGRDLNETLSLIGRDKVLARLRARTGQA